VHRYLIVNPKVQMLFLDTDVCDMQTECSTHGAAAAQQQREDQEEEEQEEQEEDV
jgi:hypothetical protein